MGSKGTWLVGETIYFSVDMDVSIAGVEFAISGKSKIENFIST
jgi:hypothetical protein